MALPRRQLLSHRSMIAAGAGGSEHPLGLSRCDQTRTVGDQTRTACAIKGGQVEVARIFLSRSVAEAEENVRSRPLPDTLEQ